MSIDNMENVVCTGIGVICPAGIDKHTFCSSIIRGEHYEDDQLYKEDCFSVINQRGIIFADDSIWMVKTLRRKTYTTRMSELALAAGIQALSDADFLLKDYDPAKIGVVVGTGYGNFASQNEVLQSLLENKAKSIPPRSFSRVIHNEPGGVLAIELNLQGVNITVSQGEASAEIALCCAVQFLKSHYAETIIVIGVDEYHPSIHSYLQNNRKISDFDVFRKGYIAGEGAGALLLETKRQAKDRGASIYGEIVDFSIKHNDIISSVNEVLSVTGISKKQVDYIISDADNSFFRDKWEMDGLKQALEEDFYLIPIGSIGPIIGRFPAFGVIRTAALLLSMHSKILPQTFNLKNRYSACVLPPVQRYILQSCFVPSSSTISIIIKKGDDG
ncbi:MAG: beta-ketoacyl synthase chain length factor [Deltaproteobacteria bacterium]|nr:beta-ketoacyl synthase chain length factor [Deltaproteobacteria bacterium]